MLLSEEKRNERLHAAPCEQRRRVILRNERCRRNFRMPALLEELDIFSAYLADVHLPNVARFSSKEKGVD